RFEEPDEVRQMVKGRFEIVHIGGVTIGRATYEPGWRWSEHVGPALGATRCHVEHVGLVLSGTATAAFDDAALSHCMPVNCFTLQPIPTTVGGLGTSRTSLFIFSALTTTPVNSSKE